MEQFWFRLVMRNSEIFYPPYLFTKNWVTNIVLADEPKIINFNDEVNRGKSLIEIEEVVDDDIYWSNHSCASF